MSEHGPDETARQRAVDGLLRELSRHEPGADESFIESTIQKVNRRESWSLLPMAACLAVAFVVLGIMVFKKDPEAQTDFVVQVEDIVGEVFTRDGELVSGALKLPQKLSCDESSSVTVRYPDGTKVDLSSGEFELSIIEKDQKKVRVRSGRAFCSVKPQPDSAPMRFYTPHGEGEVLGTVFQVSVGDKNTRLQTVKGNVRVRKSGEQWTQVEAGCFADMKWVDSIVAETMEIDDLMPGDIIWSQEFGNEYGPEVDLEGSRVEIVENGERFWGAQSRPTGGIFEENEGWYPDQCLTLEMESREGLFPAVEDMEIVLRMRAETAGRFQVALIPADKKVRKEHVITDGISTPTSWGEVVIPLSKFVPYRASRMPVSGMQISSVALWGFESGVIQVDRVIVRRAVEARP